MAFTPEETPEPKSKTVKGPPLKEQKPNVATLLWDIKHLPSVGKAYPDDAVIKYRAYTFGEVKTISQSQLNLRDIHSYILDGVEITTKDENFDVLDLTVQDGLFIGFLRKKETFGKQNRIMLPYTCTKCGQENKHTLEDENDIEFQDLDIESLPINYELSTGEKLSFTPVTFRTLPKMWDHYDEIQKSGDKKDKLNFVTLAASLAAQCNTHEYKESYDLITGTRAQEDHEAFEKINEMLNHHVMPIKTMCRMKVNDQFCAGINTISLDEVDRLVLPFRETGGKHPKSRISFG